MRLRNFLIVGLLVLGACGKQTTTISHKDNETSLGGNYPDVKSYCDPNESGVRIYVTRISGEAGGAVAVIVDSDCP